MAAMAARCDAIATDFVAESDRVFLGRHAPELDNLRTALACAQASDGDAAMALAGAFARIGALLSLTGESLAHLDRAEAHVTPRTAPLALARLQVARSLFARSQPLDRVLDGLRAAIAALRAAGRPVECLHAAAQFTSRCRRWEVAEAGTWLERVRMLCADDPRPPVQLHLAQAEYGVAVDRDGVDDQRHWLAQILALATGAGQEHAVHLAQWNLGWLAALHGDPAGGAANARVILARAEGGAPNLTWLANGLALLLTSLLGLGQSDEARGVALRLVVLGVPLRRMHEFSDSFALLCVMHGDCAAAARLIGFADAESQRLASRRDRAGRRNRDLAFERARRALGDARMVALMRQGAALQAVQIEALLASGIAMESDASTAEPRAGRRMRAQ
jgi:hypothetical protein